MDGPLLITMPRISNTINRQARTVNRPGFFLARPASYHISRRAQGAGLFCLIRWDYLILSQDMEKHGG